jgi:hypothetical protein
MINSEINFGIVSEAIDERIEDPKLVRAQFVKEY